MAIYLVCYDLRKPNYTENDYEDLWEELAKLKAKRVQDSVWGLNSDLGTEALLAKIKPHIHRGDRLLIAELDEWQSVNGLSRLKDL